MSKGRSLSTCPIVHELNQRERMYWLLKILKPFNQKQQPIPGSLYLTPHLSTVESKEINQWGMTTGKVLCKQFTEGMKKRRWDPKSTQLTCWRKATLICECLQKKIPPFHPGIKYLLPISHIQEEWCFHNALYLSQWPPKTDEFSIKVWRRICGNNKCSIRSLGKNLSLDFKGENFHTKWADSCIQCIEMGGFRRGTEINFSLKRESNINRSTKIKLCGGGESDKINAFKINANVPRGKQEISVMYKSF